MTRQRKRKKTTCSICNGTKVYWNEYYKMTMPCPKCGIVEPPFMATGKSDVVAPKAPIPKDWKFKRKDNWNELVTPVIVTKYKKRLFKNDFIFANGIDEIKNLKPAAPVDGLVKVLTDCEGGILSKGRIELLSEAIRSHYKKEIKKILDDYEFNPEYAVNHIMELLEK